jgi:hypothetical protein
MTQEVECLPSKHEALSLNPGTTKKKKKEFKANLGFIGRPHLKQTKQMKQEEKKMCA